MRHIVSVLVLLLVASFAYAAPDRTGKFDAGFNVSGIIPTEDGADNSVYVGGNLAYGLNEWLAVGFEAGFSEIETESADNVALGDLNALPVMGDVIFRLPTESPVQPYGVVGLGVIFFDFDESRTLQSLGLKVDVDDAFAVKTGIGIDWFVNDSWALNLEGSYVFSEADAELLVLGTSLATDSIDTDYWMIGGGVKYLFN